MLILFFVLQKWTWSVFYCFSFLQGNMGFLAFPAPSWCHKYVIMADLRAWKMHDFSGHLSGFRLKKLPAARGVFALKSADFRPPKRGTQKRAKSDTFLSQICRFFTDGNFDQTWNNYIIIIVFLGKLPLEINYNENI